MSEAASIEDQIQDCEAQVRHLLKYLKKYQDVAKAEEDAGHQGQLSWETATGNVEAYRKAIDGVNGLLAHLRSKVGRQK